MRARASEEIRQEILERINRGSDPVADAMEATNRGEYGLIILGQYAVYSPAGVTCFTPYGQAPRVTASYGHSDVIDHGVQVWYDYAIKYNQTVVARPGYPDADLCRIAEKSDQDIRRSAFPVSNAARPVSAPAHTLHEAARRGKPSDIRRLLTAGVLNTTDGLDMTPLAWAVARDNAAAVDLLLKAGANPWASGNRKQDAVFFAAQLGRRIYFKRMEAIAGRPFKEWPGTYVSAAASGGDDEIVALMLAQPHASPRFELLGSPLPSAATLEPILKADPKLAIELLWKTTGYSSDRLDLVQLALKYGADPNVTVRGRYGTVLGEFAKGISPASVEIVDALLKGGADPNLISHWQRPIWVAVRILKLDDDVTEVDGRATAIFQKLLKAGANINLPDDQGVPPAWLLFFPYRYDHTKLDASFVTPQLLEMLVKNGLDLNAEWQGKRILPLVEAQGGADSELAIALRRLGAHR